MILTTKYNPPSRNIESDIDDWINKISQALMGNGFNKEIATRIAYAGAKNLINSLKVELFKGPISFHLVPKNEMWAVISENGKEIFFEDVDYNTALAEARQLAKKNKLKLVLHNENGWAKDSESFQVNRPFVPSAL